MNKYLIVFFVAALVSLLATPIAKAIALKIGAVDVPKDARRVHNKPIPRLGGLAIYLGFIISVLAVVPVDTRIIGMLIGGTLIVAMGIIDDIKPLPAKVKLSVQIVCSMILVLFGLKIGGLTVPFTGGQIISLGILSIPVTIFWTVGITNTLNLIDGLDGLAAGVATIAALSLSYVAHVNIVDTGEMGTITVLMTLGIAGAAIGFLPYNFNPAKIFMGDTGSLFLGYMLSAISIYGFVKGATALATVVPVLALGLPIFDTAFAILRRAINRKPIMQPDKGHLHHKLLSTGLGQKRTVLILYAVSGVFGISAAFMSTSKLLDSMIILFVTSAVVYASFVYVVRYKSADKE